MVNSVVAQAAPTARRHPVPRRVPVLMSVIGLALVLAAQSASAQGQGNVQVTARVLFTEPSRLAWQSVRAARSVPPTALFRVSDTGGRALPVADWLARPRRIITIEFLQN